MSRIRKALIAFVSPILGLPLVAWIDTTDTIPFSWEVFLGTVSYAAVQAFLVYRVPNAEKALG